MLTSLSTETKKYFRGNPTIVKPGINREYDKLHNKQYKDNYEFNRKRQSQMNKNHVLTKSAEALNNTQAFQVAKMQILKNQNSFSPRL